MLARLHLLGHLHWQGLDDSELLLMLKHKSERIPSLRSLYMVVGTGSRSTAEVPVVLLLVKYRRAFRHAAGASMFGKRNGVARLVGWTWQLSWNWVEDVVQTWPSHLRVGLPELLDAPVAACLCWCSRFGHCSSERSLPQSTYDGAFCPRTTTCEPQ